MRIFVFGNINSGKSSLIEKLAKIYPDKEILKIDDFRVLYGDGTNTGEVISQHEFIKAVKINNDSIVECTGTGPVGEKLSEINKHRQDIILYMKTDLDVCLKRLEKKSFEHIPYPKVDQSIEEVIKWIHGKHLNGEIERLWFDKVLQIFSMINNDIDNIPFDTLEHFNNIINSIIHDSSVRAIYPYGSFLRNELNKLSDIDCFIITDNNIGYFVNKIKDIDKYFVDEIYNKIVVRYQDSLIELVLLKSLSEGEKYLQGFLIENPLKHYIKIDLETRSYLSSVQLSQNAPSVEIKLLYSKMIYFTQSLPNLIQTSNKYKYYFHFNIALHNYLRICEIKKGNIEKNYLPSVDFKNYEQILLTPNMKLEAHFHMFLKLVNEIVKDNFEYCGIIDRLLLYKDSSDKT